MPLLSIIIATYNAEMTLARCFESVFSQTFKNFEVLVVDGLSTDHTVSIINKFSDKIAYWHSRKDNGVYDAWNQAIEKAAGEYICFIGADDYFTSKDSLSIIFDAIRNSTYDLISFQGTFIQSVTSKEYIIGAPWDYDCLIKMPICHPGLLHHKSLFEKIGNFDLSYRIASDYDFMLRLPKETTSLHLNTPLITISDGGISRNKYHMQMKEKWAIRSKNPRIGKIKAAFHYLNKLWRVPIARALNIPY